jgi:predicted N-formylglutamate amidohydrolase
MRDGLGSDVASGLVDRPLAGETFDIVPAGARPGHRGVVPVLLCDHAGNAFPPGYGTLGLPPGQIERHIAYDIGAAGVVRAMAWRLGAAAVLSRYSRLLIDVNRGPDDPTLIMRLSDGAVVPGNHPIDAAEWNKRIRLYHEPYHRAVGRVIQDVRRQGLTPVIVSVHSFTEAWKGAPRPWHVGILWARDGRLPQRLMAALSADPKLVVGDNEPYSGQLEGDTMDRHATANGIAHALVEIRQDLIAMPAGQQAWADRFSGILETMLADPVIAADLQVLSPKPHMSGQKIWPAPSHVPAPA